jgi:hypothetical protein
VTFLFPRPPTPSPLRSLFTTASPPSPQQLPPLDPPRPFLLACDGSTGPVYVAAPRLFAGPVPVALYLSGAPSAFCASCNCVLTALSLTPVNTSSAGAALLVKVLNTSASGMAVLVGSVSVAAQPPASNSSNGRRLAAALPSAGNPWVHASWLVTPPAGLEGPAVLRVSVASTSPRSCYALHALQAHRCICMTRGVVAYTMQHHRSRNLAYCSIMCPM